MFARSSLTSIIIRANGRRLLSNTSAAAVAGAKDAAAFESFMNNRQGSVITEDLDAYNQDWSVSYDGSSMSDASFC